MHLLCLDNVHTHIQYEIELEPEMRELKYIEIIEITMMIEIEN